MKNKIVILTDSAMPKVEVIALPQMHPLVEFDPKRKERRAASALDSATARIRMEAVNE